jgi:hypothetical protein
VIPDVLVPEGVPSELFEEDSEPTPNLQIDLQNGEGRKKPDKSRHFRPAQMEMATKEVREFMGTGEWGTATPRHFLALFELLHSDVYGAPYESNAVDRSRAAMMAGKILHGQFGGEPWRMADFLSWCWSRERKQEKWRLANGREGGRRVGWQLQFSLGMVNDYRVDMARMKVRSNAR